MPHNGPITGDVDAPSAWSASDTYDFEAEARRFVFPDLDVELESGDEIVTDRGRRTFDRAIRDTRGQWTLLYREGMSHGPGYAGMKFRQNEWHLAEEYAGVQDL